MIKFSFFKNPVWPLILKINKKNDLIYLAEILYGALVGSWVSELSKLKKNVSQNWAKVMYFLFTSPVLQKCQYIKKG